MYVYRLIKSATESSLLSGVPVYLVHPPVSCPWGHFIPVVSCLWGHFTPVKTTAWLILSCWGQDTVARLTWCTYEWFPRLERKDEQIFYSPWRSFISSGAKRVGGMKIWKISKGKQQAKLGFLTVQWRIQRGFRGFAQTPLWVQIISFWWGIWEKLGELIKSNSAKQIWTPYPKILDPSLSHIFRVGLEPM